MGFKKVIIFITSFVLLMLIVVFINSLRNTSQNLRNEINHTKSDKQFDFKNNLIKIKGVILREFPDLPEELNITLGKFVDINDDGVDEALINLNYGGAATQFYTLIQFKNNEPGIIKFKDKDEKTEGKILVKGSGGAGRYGFDFDILKREIIQKSYSAYNSPDDFCKAEVYIYNPVDGLFEYNENKSVVITKEYCQNLCKSIGDDLKTYFENICKQI